MNGILWILIIISFVIAFIGLIKPIIPAILFPWVGFLIYQFGIDASALSWVFWGAMVILTVFVFLSDILMNRLFVKRFGGSKKAEWGAFLGVIIGVFVLPPFGILIVPFILVLIIEMIQTKDIASALKVSFGSVLAFFSSTIAQGFIMLVMIIWFFLDVWIN